MIGEIGLTTPARVDPAAEPAVLVPAADHGGGAGADPFHAAPSPEFLQLIPQEFARRHLILSGGRRERVEHLLVGPGTAAHIVHNVARRLGRGVSVDATPIAPELLAAAIDRAYASASSAQAEPGQPMSDLIVEGAEDVQAAFNATLQAAESDLINIDGKEAGGSVRLVDLILFEALQKGASDVHVQPLNDRTLIRYRLDGALHTVRVLRGGGLTGLASSVISRIKIMGKLDVAERRAPQDGRATVSIGGSGTGNVRAGRRIDLRISTLPSTFGERVVIRLLDPSRSPHLTSFAALGMPTATERRYLAQAARTSGIVLSTGPTGSGKTTTLYTTLAWIAGANSGATARGCELNMMTIEDPVEYDLSGASKDGTAGAALSVSQTQVDPRKNLTFATGLRHILRQDPDVIMVGEVRDEETARIAVQASLTGHLVLSTLHTNDAAGAIARLLDLGVEPFLASSSLSAVLAQRLVRKLHAPCAGRGCEDCLGTGYRGRTGVFELLVVDSTIRDLIGGRASAVDIKSAAQKLGMVTLRDEGIRLVRAGLTTAAEVTRVIEALEELET